LTRHQRFGAAIGLVVALIVIHLAASGEAVTHSEAEAMRHFAAIDDTWLHKPVRDDLHRVLPLGLLAMLAWAAWCDWQQRRLEKSWSVAAAIGLAVLSVDVLKELTSSARFSPWLAELQIPPSSWPSGHATQAIVLGGLAVRAWPGRKVLTVPLAIVIVALASACSLISHSHWISDVAGGWVLGALVLLVSPALDAIPRTAQTAWMPLALLTAVLVGCGRPGLETGYFPKPAHKICARGLVAAVDLFPKFQDQRTYAELRPYWMRLVARRASDLRELRALRGASEHRPFLRAFAAELAQERRVADALGRAPRATVDALGRELVRRHERTVGHAFDDGLGQCRFR
jgi:membrane-associated phospholipid phosphatase